jgi:hypothetical protein
VWFGAVGGGLHVGRAAACRPCEAQGEYSMLRAEAR